jgi:metallo-beta-lactamase class B
LAAILRSARFWTALVVPVLFLPSCAKGPTGPNDDSWHFFPGHVESFSSPLFRAGRQCWVYLPPGYASSSERYPVLYLNDGEVAFDANDGLHANRITEELIRQGVIRPIIIVAIENGAGHQRWIDYTPWTSPTSAPNGGGDAYLIAIRDTLIPAVDGRYRTLHGPGNTAIGGMSLGGLIATYAGYAYDSSFGMVGALSPSYGYASYKIEQYATAVGRPPAFARFYQDTGYPDDNDITHMEAIAIAQGFTPGVDLMSVTSVGAQHRVGAWERRLPQMLTFLFKR